MGKWEGRSQRQLRNVETHSSGKSGLGKIGVTSKHFTFVIQKSANFPRHIAREIVEDLEAALQQFAAIAQDLKK